MFRRLYPTVLAVMLLSSPAVATTYDGDPATDNEVITHALGEMRRGAAERFCGAPQVFVGDIVSVSSYVYNYTSSSTGQHSFIMSDVTFKVASTLKGQPGQFVTLKLEGGTVGTTTVSPSKGRIQPIVGYRYAVAFAPRPTGSFPAQILYSYALMDPSVALSSDLRQEFESAESQHCSQGGQ